MRTSIKEADMPNVDVDNGIMSMYHKLASVFIRSNSTIKIVIDQFAKE